MPYKNDMKKMWLTRIPRALQAPMNRAAKRNKKTLVAALTEAVQQYVDKSKEASKQ